MNLSTKQQPGVLRVLECVPGPFFKYTHFMETTYLVLGFRVEHVSQSYEG